MRSFFFILLSCIFLNSSTELHQLFKLPFLLLHYQHHREEDKSLTLITFLHIHYSENHPLDNDDDDDNQLPFKAAGKITHLDTVPATIKESPEKISALFLGKLRTIYQEGILSEKSYSIFHPPRLSSFIQVIIIPAGMTCC